MEDPYKSCLYLVIFNDIASITVTFVFRDWISERLGTLRVGELVVRFLGGPCVAADTDQMPGHGVFPIATPIPLSSSVLL